MYEAGLPGMETFHAPPVPAGASASTGLRGRVNFLNWDGRGTPGGLFPRRRKDESR
ncbi:hypothetical protein [Streptomyces sp. NPDC001415]